jgi:hypothetical protein
MRRAHPELRRILTLMVLLAGCGEGLLSGGEPEDPGEIDESGMEHNLQEGSRGATAACPNGGKVTPATPSFAGDVDGYAGYAGQSSCSSTAQPGVTAFRDLVVATYPCLGSGSINRGCSVGGKSEHKEGRAWDWPVNVGHAAPDALLGWLLASDAQGNAHAMARRLGLMYIIWNRKIWKAYQPSKGWQSYSGASPHTDHVHFSFSWAGAKKQTSFWQGGAPAPAPTPSDPSPAPQPAPSPAPASPAGSFYLTSYDDGTTPACGGKKIDGAWYYSTGASRFGCNARLRLEANGKCVVVAVVDNGPASWVEANAAQKCGGTGQIIDASPLVAQHLFGTSSAGWSDCFGIQVSTVASSAATGPVACAASPAPTPAPAPAPSPTPTPSPDGGTAPTAPSGDGFIGDPCTSYASCASGQCLGDSAGWTNGTCTESCTHLCPDQAGKPVTFCVAVSGNGQCVSRCDTSFYPGTGCRPGYHCVKMPRFDEPSTERNVCLPESGIMSRLPGARPADLEGDRPNPEVSGGCSTGGGARGDLWMLVLLAGLLLRRREG